jgi:putative colanic acid biosynthesis acetyltransferase WcaF
VSGSAHESESRTVSPARRWLWRYAGAPLFRMTPHNFNSVRRAILRAFGARITPTTKFRRSVRIDRPWNISAGELTVVGDCAAFRAAEPIRIGDRCVVSQYAILTTEARDPDMPDHPVRTAPIAIEDDCWIATDTLVLPGSHVRQGTVVGARGLVEGELPGWSIAVGEPAVPRGRRELRPVEAPR